MARLQRKRSRKSERMAAESEEQREARLRRMSNSQRKRLARESQDEREARLDRMIANQREIEIGRGVSGRA